MKRKFKRIASLVLAAIMVFAMAMPAMAAQPTGGKEQYKIKVKASKYDENHGHVYNAYQIFKGDLAFDASGDKILSNIDWADGFTDPEARNAVLAAFKDVEGGEDFTGNLPGLLDYLGKHNNAETAKTIAKALEGKNLGEPVPLPWNGLDHYESATEVDAGYYLIIDGGPAATGDAISDYMVQVIEDMDITPKVAAPSVDKQVQDNDDTLDSSEGAADGWGETADHNLNETFKFKLKADLPAGENGLSQYTKYKLVFNDTLYTGLTYMGNIQVVIKDASGAVQKTLSVGSDYLVEGVSENDKGTAGGLKWTLTIGDLIPLLESVGLSLGTDNIIVEVTYDVMLNNEAEMAKNGAESENNRNEVTLQYSHNPNNEELGETVPDKVFVFTYELPTRKIDGEGFDPDNPEDATGLKGAKFSLYKTNEGGDALTFSLKDGESGKYYYDPNGRITELESDENGNFHIAGLDEGTYYLEETAAPAGYNSVTGREEITIDATDHKENTEGTKAHTDFTIDGKTNIVNNKGTTLPETGGIGTTIFYVVGSVLVLGAVILLVTKRRMKG